jgi:MFS transporter, BCD family, chlorophyll transporter
MKPLEALLVNGLRRIGTRYLPFADAASAGFTLGRLLRLSLFQVSAGLTLVLLNGTLNRVMIVELSVPAWLVSLMVSLPLVFAPLRALIGFQSDHHRSALGWRRVPYIWIGTLLQFGGLAIMPFALILLGGDSQGPALVGELGAALAFLLVGAGLHTTQTAGLALATDLAPASRRARVVALLYLMLLLGTVGAALISGQLLAPFSELRLIRVLQGSALLILILNVTALWKQEARAPAPAERPARRPAFRESWAQLMADPRSARLLVGVGLGSAAFSMQDILLEPFGGQIMHMAVGATTSLTALLAGGGLLAFALAAYRLGRQGDPHRLAGLGGLCGVAAFALLLLAHPLDSLLMLRAGVALIGFGGGLFSVSTLSAAMSLERSAPNGLALGAWGAVQATCGGVAIAFGGALRDAVGALALQGRLGPALNDPASGYGAVYLLEIILLFITLAAIGPLVRMECRVPIYCAPKFGLAELPG